MPEKQKFFKNADTGAVFAWTIHLAKRDHMLPCNADGSLLCKADARFDQSELTLRDKIDGARKKADLVDIAARYDVGFTEEMKLKDMKIQFIDHLIELSLLEPTDEDMERLSKGSGTKDEDGPDDDG